MNSATILTRFRSIFTRGCIGNLVEISPKILEKSLENAGTAYPIKLPGEHLLRGAEMIKGHPRSIFEYI